MVSKLTLDQGDAYWNMIDDRTPIRLQGPDVLANEGRLLWH